MKKRRAAALLAAAVYLGSVFSSVPQIAVHASAQEVPEVIVEEEEILSNGLDTEASDGTGITEAVDEILEGAEIISDSTDEVQETSAAEEPRRSFGTESEFQTEETAPLRDETLEKLIDGEVILDAEEVTEPENLEGESEIFETELEQEEEVSHSGRAEDGSAMMRAAVRTVYSGSYGNQLSGQSAQLYNAMKTNFLQNGKKDSFTLKLSGITFPVYPQTDSDGTTQWNLNSNETYLYTIKPEIAAMVQAAYDAFVYDYPDVFWLGAIRYGTSISLKKPAGSTQGTGEITQLTITPTEEYSKAWSERSSFQKTVTSWKNAIQKKFPDGASQEDKVRVIHDYVCAKLSYDDAVSSEWDWSAGGALLHGGSVVCEGYAKTFKILCSSFGIECVLVSGKAKSGESWESHMWNYVCMENGKWYLIDTTWDDSNRADTPSLTYFLRGSSGIGADGTTQIGMERMVDSTFSNASSQAFAHPELASKDYAEDDDTTHRHKWEVKSKLEPTCEESGMIYYICSGCKATKLEAVNPTGHKFTKFVSNHDETCEKDGTKTAVCDYCKKKTCTLQNVNSKKGHSYRYVYNKNATVFKDGTKTGTCIRCGKKVTVSAAGTKLKPTIKINVSSVRLRVGQVTTGVKVSGLAKGDGIKSWTSGNSSIIKVDRSSGKMTAGTKTGSTIVTVTLKSGLKKTINVTVQKTAVRTTKLTGLPDSVTVAKGKTVKLVPVRVPVTSQEKVTYAIGNKAVASVASNGVVKGLKKGKTKLTVRSGSKSVTVLVVVTG